MAVSHLLELWSFLSRRGKRYNHVGYRVTVAVYSSTCLFGTRKLLYRYLKRIVLIRSVNEPANADLQVLYLWRANSGQQKVSWEADIRSVSRNIICLVWKSKTNFPVHKFRFLGHIRSQMNPFYTFTFHNLKVHINIILLPMPRSRNGLFFSRFHFSFYAPNVFTVPATCFISFSFIWTAVYLYLIEATNYEAYNYVLSRSSCYFHNFISKYWTSQLFWIANVYSLRKASGRCMILSAVPIWFGRCGWCDTVKWQLPTREKKITLGAYQEKQMVAR